MLIDNGLDQHFRAEAANTACYLITKIPCRGANISRAKIWSGRCPNLKFLSFWMSQKRNVANWIENRMNPESKSIIISRDIEFLEAMKVGVNLSTEDVDKKLL